MEPTPINTEINNQPAETQVLPAAINRPPFFKGKKFLVFGSILIVVLLASTYLILKFAGNNQNSQFKEAESAYLEGNFEQTQKKLETAYNAESDNPRVQAALIETIANRGNLHGTETESYEEAKPYVKNALATNPGNHDVLLAIGYLEETAGNYEIALGYYQKALDVEPESAQGWFHLGHVLEFLNKQEEAFPAYVKAYSLDQNDPLISMSYAKTKVFKKEYFEAISLYDAASKMSNASPTLKAEALTNASIISRIDLNNFPQALAYSTQAVELGDNFSPALAEHGFNMAMNNQLDEGIEFMKRAIEANPRISQNYWRLGSIYRLKGDFASAAIYQEQALERIDNDNTLLGNGQRNIIKASIEYDLATTYARTGQTDRVYPMLQLAILHNPNLKTQLLRDLDEYNTFESLGDIASIRRLAV